MSQQEPELGLVGTVECEHPNCDRTFESQKALGSHYGQVHGPRKGEAECRNCQEPFEVPKHREDEAVYCSDECMSEKFSEVTGEDHDYYERVGTDCAWCGEALSLPPSLVKRAENNFCDGQCQAQYKSENPLTDNLPSGAEMRGPDHPLWKGGTTESYAGMWDRQRERAKTRDDRKCVDCGVHEDDYPMALDVHHIIPYREFSDPVDANRLDNLVTVCRPCHMEREYQTGGDN